jgi:hypothetical protein
VSTNHETPGGTGQQFAASGAGRRRAFQFVCRALSRQTAEPLLTAKEADEIDWLCVAEQVNREQVVPNLFAALERQGWPACVPGDFRDYLTWIHEANTIQNRRIRVQILDLGDTLGAAGIPFVLLKGANWLLEAGDEIGGRQLTDIDLLVAPETYQAAVGALEAAGFRAAASPEPYARHFHHVPLARPGDAVTVELHRHLGWQRHLLTPDEVIAAAEPFGEAASIGIMSPTHRFVFGCLHAQLQNMGYGSGMFSLRDLTDIRHLLEHKADSLDWPAIAAFGRERGIYRYLALPLHLAGHLLSVEVPEPFARSRLARLHALRCLAQRRLDPGQGFGRLAIKIAWLMDARRHSYERDCEEAAWPLRHAAIARGRLRAFFDAARGRKRAAVSVKLEDAADS